MISIPLFDPFLFRAPTMECNWDENPEPVLGYSPKPVTGSGVAGY